MRKPSSRPIPGTQLHPLGNRGTRSKTAIRLLSVVGLLVGALNVTGSAQATFPGRNGAIAFEGLQDQGRSEIFTVRADGEHLRQLTHEPSGSLAYSARFSPDGRQITYCVASESCEYKYGSLDARIWVMNRDGSNQHQVTNDPSYFDADPNWSPDGHHIVFSRCSVRFRTCDIDVMNADGSHIRTLIGGHWHHGTPAYSPDGSMIAFSSDKGGYDTRIWVARSDGSHPRPITPASLFGSGVNWAPDSSRIFFTGHAFDNGRVWTVRPNGSDRRQLTHFPSYSGGYSPNGRKLIATDFSVPGCGCNGLVLLNRDGTIRKPVVTSDQVPGVGGFTFDWGVAP